MTPAQIAALRSAGIDYKAGVARFVDDAALYEMVLSAFLRDETLEKARQALERGDRAALLRYAHVIKGSSGNADITALYAHACALVDLLREPDPGDAEIRAAFARFQASYTAAKEALRAALEG